MWDYDFTKSADLIGYKLLPLDHLLEASQQHGSPCFVLEGPASQPPTVATAPAAALALDWPGILRLAVNAPAATPAPATVLAAVFLFCSPAAALAMLAALVALLLHPAPAIFCH